MNKTMTVVALHGVDDKHLAAVIDEMRRLGAPTVRAIDIAGVYYAIEGTHRLAAAAQLGIVPEIEVVGGDDKAIVDGLDLDDRSTWTIGELREYVGGSIGYDRPIYKVQS